MFDMIPFCIIILQTNWSCKETRKSMHCTLYAVLWRHKLIAFKISWQHLENDLILHCRFSPLLHVSIHNAGYNVNHFVYKLISLFICSFITCLLLILFYNTVHCFIYYCKLNSTLAKRLLYSFSFLLRCSSVH